MAHRGDELRLELRGVDGAVALQAHVLSTLAFRDVDDGGQDEVALRGAQRVEPDLDRDLGAVPVQAEQVAARAHRARARHAVKAGAQRAVSRAEALRDEVLDRHAEQLRAGIPEQALALRVHERDGAATVDHEHRVRRRVDHEAQVFRVVHVVLAVRYFSRAGLPPLV